MDIRLNSTSLRAWVDDEGPDLVLVLSDGESRAVLAGEGEMTELALRRLADTAMQLVALLGVRAGSPRPLDRTEQTEPDPRQWWHVEPPMNAGGL